jgi:hypothetical protein
MESRGGFVMFLIVRSHTRVFSDPKSLRKFGTCNPKLVNCANLAMLEEYRQQCLPYVLTFHHLVLPYNFAKFKVTYEGGQNASQTYNETMKTIKIVTIAKLKESNVPLPELS